MPQTKEQFAIWRKNNQDKMHKYQKRDRLKKRYNLTIEQRSQMFIEQNGMCGICEQQFDDKDLCVDHNHTTGKVRKLLCSSCNTGIGRLKEDINILRNAIRYLQQQNEE